MVCDKVGVKDSACVCVCDKVVCERRCVTKMVSERWWVTNLCEKIVCERWCVTKLCVKEGV